MDKCALIVDDHPIVRDALVTSLVSLEVFNSVETCSTFSDTIAHLERNRDYDLVILDLSLADTDGNNGMTWMRESYPDTPVIIFSANDSAETITRAFELGVHGFVSKSSPVQVIVQAIKLVLAGGTYLPPEIMPVMGFSTPEVRDTGDESAVSEPVHFSPKQKAVLDLLVQGLPNKVIADRLSIAEGTVKTHVHSVYQTLRVKNRAQAILKARQLKLID